MIIINNNINMNNERKPKDSTGWALVLLGRKVMVEKSKFEVDLD